MFTKQEAINIAVNAEYKRLRKSGLCSGKSLYGEEYGELKSYVIKKLNGNRFKIFDLIRCLDNEFKKEMKK